MQTQSPMFTGVSTKKPSVRKFTQFTDPDSKTTLYATGKDRKTLDQVYSTPVRDEYWITSTEKSLAAKARGQKPSGHFKNYGGPSHSGGKNPFSFLGKLLDGVFEIFD